MAYGLGDLYLTKCGGGRLLMESNKRRAVSRSATSRLSPSALLLMEARVSRGGKGLPSSGGHCASHILSGTLLRWLSPEMLGQQRVAKGSKEQPDREDSALF